MTLTFLPSYAVQLHNQLQEAHELLIACRYTESCKIFDTIVDQIHQPDILCNYGFALRHTKQYEKAENIYTKVLSINPDYARAHRAFSHILLAQEKWEKGWQEYEWRWRPIPPDHKKLKEYITQHKTLNNKTVLLKTEYGYGDTFQFIRYAYVLKQLNAHIILQTKKELVPLFSTCSYIDQIILFDESPPKHDFSAFIMSMPHILYDRIAHIPTFDSYLFAQQQLVTEWQQKRTANKKVKIGIGWQADLHEGSPHSQVQRDAQAKSIALDRLAPLLASEHTTFYSLQKDVPATTNIISFNNFDTTNGSFMDSAALMCNLDLVITIDTSIAHLAGALGKPVWVLLPFVADWRWGNNSNYSCWYPTMRLFRQTKENDWHTVIEHVTNELKIFTQN